MPIDRVKIQSDRAALKLFFSMLAMLVFLLLLVIRAGLVRDLYIEVLLNVCGVVMLVGFTNILESEVGEKTKGFFSWMSYASLAAYLIHNLFFGFFKAVCMKSVGDIPVYMAPLMLTVVFAVAYFLQRVYDWFIKKCILSK